MKRLIIAVLLLIYYNTFCFAQKGPKKTGLIQEFTGVITSASSWDYNTYFAIKDAKKGEIQFYISTCMNDKYSLESDIPNDLMTEIYEGDPKGKKVKVLAKSTYGVFDNYEGNGPSTYKHIIWRPVVVKIL